MMGNNDNNDDNNNDNNNNNKVSSVLGHWHETDERGKRNMCLPTTPQRSTKISRTNIFKQTRERINNIVNWGDVVQ